MSCHHSRAPVAAAMLLGSREEICMCMYTNAHMQTHAWYQPKLKSTKDPVKVHEGLFRAISRSVNNALVDVFVLFPSICLASSCFTQFRVLLSKGKYSPCGLSRNPWANGQLSLRVTYSWAQETKQSDGPKESHLPFQHQRDYLIQDKPFSCSRKLHVKLLLEKGSIEIRSRFKSW